MNPGTRDPLLLAGTAIAVFMQGVMVVAAAALAIAIPALVIFKDRVNAEFAEEVGKAAVELPIMAIAGLMLAGLVLVGLLFVFFGRLRAIIATVGQGDPFQPENADRLAQMGWIMVAVQLLTIPAAAIGVYLVKFFDAYEKVKFSSDAGLDVGGITLTIILFILARVFRHGAAMREDLEGTV